MNQDDFDDKSKRIVDDVIKAAVDAAMRAAQPDLKYREERDLLSTSEGKASHKKGNRRNPKVPRNSAPTIVPMSRNRNSQIKIYLFGLGYVYGLNLRKVAQLMNLKPAIFQVTVGDPIRNIGAPDFGNIAFSDKLFEIFPRVNDGMIKIGVIDAPIKNNFFSRVNDHGAIILSLYQSDELCQKSGKSKEEYIVQGIVTEILWLFFKDNSASQDIYHEDTRGCIFDFCARKPEKVHKLRTSTIDPICRGKLIEANVPESLIQISEKILERVRIPNFVDVLQNSLRTPVFSFLVGGLFFGVVVNLISSLVLGEFDTSGDFLLSLIILLLLIIIIFMNYFFTVRKLKRKIPF